MKTTLELNTAILEIIKPACSSGLWGLRQSKITVPACDPDHALFHIRIAAEGPREFLPLAVAQAGQSIPGNPYDLIARVALSLLDFTLPFPALHPDAHGFSHDCLVKGVLGVVEPRVFVEQLAAQAPLGAPLRREGLAEWLVRELTPPVQDFVAAAARDHTFEQVRGGAPLPSGRWAALMAPLLERFGLRPSGLVVTWESAEARRAEQAEQAHAAQKQQRQQADEADRLGVEQARREQAMAVELARIDAEKQRALRDVSLAGHAGDEQRQRLEEEYRQRRLLAEQKYREAQLTGEKQLQALKQALEREAMDHELALLRARAAFEDERKEKAEAREKAATDGAGMARLERERAELARQQAEEELQEAVARRKHLEQVQTKESDHLARLEGVLEQVMKMFTSGILEKLLSPKTAESYDAAGWVTKMGVSAQNLKDLGIPTHQQFIERFQAGTVQVRKANLGRRNFATRDIKAGPVENVAVDTLPIFERVDFEFTSPRAGYVTIINPGTSGAFSLHAPNGYRSAPRVEAGRTYCVPGPEILPRNELAKNGLDYYEGGPKGWEYLVVIVSDEPLVDAATAARSSAKAPIVELSAQDLEGITQRLDQLAEDHWAAGAVQFRVVDR